MKPCIHIIILLCTCLSVSLLHAQEKSVPKESPKVRQTYCIPVRSVAEDSLVFTGGESMDFSLHYKWGAINADVASARFTLDTLIYNGQKVFYFLGTAQTAKFFDIFFKVRERFESWFTCDGMKPLKFTRNTYEGGYVAKNLYHYMWNAPQPYIDAKVYSSKRDTSYLQLPLTQCTLDLPALFYFARNMDFDAVEPNKKYPMTFAIDDDIYNVHFILFGRETINVKGIGKVKTIKFAAQLLKGEVFKSETDMLIWVSDDENRLPVYIEAPLSVGKATGWLSAYSGLKKPFTALVEPARTKKK